MDCPNCDAIVPSGNRFCGQCGTALPLRCRTCGSVNPAGAKFCGDCSAGLKSGALPVDRSPRTLRSTEIEAERRHLTVMFCDLVGSTVLATEIVPEDLAGVIRKFQAVCVSAVEALDGHVARFMGDGIVAYFC